MSSSLFDLMNADCVRPITTFKTKTEYADCARRRSRPASYIIGVIFCVIAVIIWFASDSVVLPVLFGLGGIALAVFGPDLAAWRAELEFAPIDHQRQQGVSDAVIQQGFDHREMINQQQELNNNLINAISQRPKAPPSFSAPRLFSNAQKHF